MQTEIAYIGLGSNLDDPQRQLKQALEAIEKLTSVKVIAVSSLYRSQPMGPQDQPDYVNAVCSIETSLLPLQLLDELQTIELAQGRIREGERWGPRTLDLDILLYGGKTITSDRLNIPHPGMLERNFVLWPLHEIAPDLIIPERGPLAAFLEKIDKQGLEAVSQV